MVRLTDRQARGVRRPGQQRKRPDAEVVRTQRVVVDGEEGVGPRDRGHRHPRQLQPGEPHLPDRTQEYRIQRSRDTPTKTRGRSRHRLLFLPQGHGTAGRRLEGQRYEGPAVPCGNGGGRPQEDPGEVHRVGKL